MRIAQLITQSRGGPVDHAVDMALQFARLGHESHLVGPPGAYADALADSGVRWHQASMEDKLDVAGAREIWRTIRDLRPDVVHCQDRRAGLIGRLAAQRWSLPSVYTLHGVPDSLSGLIPGNQQAAPSNLRDRIGTLHGERQLARVSRSMAVTPCDAVARFAEDHIGIPAERIAVVHNGIAPDWGGTDDHRAVVDGPVTAAWLGVMQPVKRVPALVHAAAGVPNLRLKLIGDGPERTRIEAAVTATGMQDRVELTGFLDDPAAALHDADLFVLPSAAEACPMAILQAMSCGLPVVASRAGGIGEVVRDGVDGILVPTGDDRRLGEALRVLTEDSGRRTALGSSARQRVRLDFTAEQCARGLLKVYAEVQS